MKNNINETLCLYHLIWEKKMPHGKVKADMTVFVPRGKLAEAVKELDEFLKKDVLSLDSGNINVEASVESSADADNTV